MRQFLLPPRAAAHAAPPAPRLLHPRYPQPSASLNPSSRMRFSAVPILASLFLMSSASASDLLQSAAPSQLLHSPLPKSLQGHHSSFPHPTFLLAPPTAFASTSTSLSSAPSTHHTSLLVRSRGGAASAVVSPVLASGRPVSSKAQSSASATATVLFSFTAWYVLNIMYNISNKQLLNYVPTLPMSVGTLQLLVGGLFWSLGVALKLPGQSIPKSVLPPQICRAHLDYTLINAILSHSSGQLLTVLSLNAGPVSFTHIIKSLEPVTNMLVKWLSEKNDPRKTSKALQTAWTRKDYLQLFSIIVLMSGVSLACYGEIVFSWFGFLTAVGSCFAFAVRSLTSKKLISHMGQVDLSTSGTANSATNASNLFGVVTIGAAIVALPFALLFEGRLIRRAVDNAVAKHALSAALSAAQQGGLGGLPSSFDLRSARLHLLKLLFMSSVYHFLNNAVMYFTLQNVSPLTLAVGNTFKRVFIVATSVLFFGTELTTPGIVGSAVAIGAVGLYTYLNA